MSEAFASDSRRTSGTRSRKPEKTEEQASLLAQQSSSVAPTKDTNNDFGWNVQVGLTLAGVASCLLTTSFGMFHVDTFLRAYRLPLPTYSQGQVVFSVINTANDVAGAWMLDHIATSRARSDLIGLSGILFALCFLSPFFRWTGPTPWDGLHFVASLSLYDTMFSFTAILRGSVISDNHHLSDSTRVTFLASTKVANLVASFAVARIGLLLFDVDHLYPFRVFVVALAAVVSLLFAIAQLLVSPGRLRQDATSKDKDDPPKTRGLAWRRVVRDFWSHRNFRAWIGMEMLLEAQTTFTTFFLKTFVDQLVLGGGVSRATCDWLLSMIRPLSQIVGIAVYFPIRQFGYPRMYRYLFLFNVTFSLSVLSLANASSTSWIIAFLVLYPVVTGAVQGAGFHLAMSDMVTEMKRKRMLEGRLDEPSLAGLFMGANALLCKPMESLLPIVTAQVMEHTNESKSSLFYVLVVPPLVFSCLQLAAWSRYDLTPQRTANMREELKLMDRTRSQSSDMELA